MPWANGPCRQAGAGPVRREARHDLHGHALRSRQSEAGAFLRIPML
jgi:hypothetical protein